MAATNVESQRLISLSLGKIAQSRSQKGGINLHKNLLVATVLHKARTACMLEYQSLQRQRQVEFQQRQQQQQKDAAALEFEAKQEQARSAALSLAAFNTSQQEPQHSLIPTCVTEMEESDSQACDSPATDPAPHESDVNVGQATETRTAALASDNATSNPVTKVGHSESCVSDFCNKENAPPSCVTFEPESDLEEQLDEDLEEESAAQVVPQSSVLPCPVDHLAAATQLAEDAGQTTARRSQTSAAPTCNVLKRQRDNQPSPSPLPDQECPPAVKKARLVAAPSPCRRNSNCNNNTPDTDQQHTCTSDSSQISNLVSIFNSGFSGLCAVSPLSSTARKEENNTSSLDLSSCDSRSESLSMSPSLSCSSSLGRMESVPSAMGLVLTV